MAAEHPSRDESVDPHVELPIDPETPKRPHLRVTAWLLVLAGAAVGATPRILLEHAWPAPPGGWPWTTFGINIVGSFVLGVVLEVLARLGSDRGRRQNVRLLAATGVCSTFTTYSAMALEITALVRDGHPAMAVGYGLGSVVVGVLAAWGGIRVGGLGLQAARREVA